VDPESDVQAFNNSLNNSSVVYGCAKITDKDELELSVNTH
jgi:hypothetical protein